MEQFNRGKIERDLKEADKIIDWVGSPCNRGGLGHPGLARLLEIQQDTLKQMLEFGVFPERVNPEFLNITTPNIMPLILNDPFQGVKQPQECPVHYVSPKMSIDEHIGNTFTQKITHANLSEPIRVRDFFNEWTSEVQKEINNLDSINH